MTATADRIEEAARVTAAWKGQFFPTPSFREFQREFELLLAERRANLAARRQKETCGLLVAGPSGAGKTTLAEAALRQHSSGLHWTCPTFVESV